MEVQSAYKVLLAAHPDFNDIRNNEKFLFWLDEQPQSISEGITKNNTDSKWAIRVLDLYKADTGLKTKSNKSNASAAEAVRTPSSREVPIDKNANKKIWKMADIAKLKSWEFEKLEKEIMQKRKELESGFRELKFIKDEMAKSSSNEGSDKIVDAASAVVASMNQKLQTTITELNAVKQALEKERAQRNKSA